MKKKKKIKLVSFICPACKKNRFISEKTIEELKKVKSIGLCAECATKKTSLKDKKKGLVFNLFSNGCTLTESSTVFSKKGRILRIGRCNKYINCRYRDKCCDLAAKYNWSGFKSDLKGYKRLTIKEKMKIYDVNLDHENDISYLKFNNIYI